MSKIKVNKTQLLYDAIKRGDNTKSVTPKNFIEVIHYLEKKISNLEQENLQLAKTVEQCKENELKYQSLFEMSDDAILIIENNMFVDCNQAVVKMLGYRNKAELLNTHPSELSPEKQTDGRFSYEKAQEMMAIALENGSNHFEWTHTRANGENFPVEVWLSKVVFGNRILINTIWRDLTDKKIAEQTIKKNIQEKEILLKEIHHRVKNNLQIITSLLNLQSNLAENESVKTILFQSKTRIESMCKVHEMLYSSKDLSSINYGNYLQDLLSKLILNAKGESNSIVLKLDVGNLIINITTAIPLGLLINELVTNSLKYAFSTSDEGTISIAIHLIDDKRLELQYSDDGVGYPATVTFENTQSLGFQLIASIVEQLNGTIKRNTTKKGTQYTLLFEKI
ncbi:MAG: hypothetical protein COX70_01670 [Flavobacteriales bacterium CG_4_10_14_0_2_um_filter_32_8]|nr:MAG: hypothetical protein COX70_01670 [Flavobacteriales bacterium CG_4_10_14_0_2_um_filter_32_8]